MSYDLAVWFPKNAISATQALQTYKQLYRGNDNKLDADDRIVLFLQELVLTYPNLDSLPSFELDNSPWDSNISINSKYVILQVKWTRAEEMASFVEQLATKHFLLFFNPQTQKLVLPEHLQKKRVKRNHWWSFLFG
jgi:hypothetical protein